MFGQRHLWTHIGSQVPSGLHVSGYTFVFRIACVMQEVFVDPFGSRTTSVMPEGVCLCGWGARGPFWAPSHPFAVCFVCVPEFVGPSGPRTPQARPICVYALARVSMRVSMCMYVCKHVHVVYACMHVYVCVCACCVCILHVFMRVCVLCMWVLGGPSGPQVTRACVHACCVFVGARWSFVDPGSPVVCWAI